MTQNQPTEVDRDTLRALVQRGAQLVEVLSKASYEKAHLAGAINLPLDSLNGQSAARLDREKPVIVYCHDYQ